MIKYIISLAAIIVFLTGCVTTKEQTRYNEALIDGPKQVALVGQRQPWLSQIEKRLRAKGFKVKRLTEKVSNTTTETYSQESARVILVVDGYAPNKVMDRCIAGGYLFAFINVELIDKAKNEIIATYTNSGFSENCAHLSGTIFTDITNLVDDTFK